MIIMKPKDAIKLDTNPLDKTYPEETVPPEDGLYRYLYQPSEQHGDQKRWATDLTSLYLKINIKIIYNRWKAGLCFWLCSVTVINSIK